MSSLTGDIDQRGSATVLSLSGQIPATEIAELNRLLARATAGRPNRLIIDVNGLTLITSPGVGALLKLSQEVADWDGQLWLVGLQPGVEDIIRDSRLDQVFDIAATIDDALTA